MKRSVETWLCVAAVAERKAGEASMPDAPWAIGNLRYYQNLRSQWLREHYRALREEQHQCPI